MILLRSLLAIIIYCYSWFIIFNMCHDDELSWIKLAFSISGFIVTYYLWPSKNKSKEEFDWYDVLDFIIDLPIEILTFPFKLIYRLFRGADISNIDIDFD